MEHPAAHHRRAFALIHHYRQGDWQAVDVTLNELEGGPEIAGAMLSSLVQICIRALEERPENPDAWLRSAMLHLAAAEGDPQPPEVA